jgi:uncharacterized protein YjbJ (UPF0337 family)
MSTVPPSSGETPSQTGLGTEVSSAAGSTTTQSSGDGSSGGSVSAAAQSAMSEAGTTKDAAVGEAQQMTQTVKEQAGEVASTLRDQARGLLDSSREQVSEQTNSQRDRAVESLRSLSDELDGMAAKATESGLGAQLAREGGQWASRAADYFDGREPGQFLDDLRELARRRPGAFLVGAAVAGVVAGRLSRGMVDAQRESSAWTAEAPKPSDDAHATLTTTDPLAAAPQSASSVAAGVRTQPSRGADLGASTPADAL